jgi:FKBP-type peptidyl-prolyl cis-trans isomerase FkpA
MMRSGSDGTPIHEVLRERVSPCERARAAMTQQAVAECVSEAPVVPMPEPGFGIVAVVPARSSAPLPVDDEAPSGVPVPVVPDMLPPVVPAAPMALVVPGVLPIVLPLVVPEEPSVLLPAVVPLRVLLPLVVPAEPKVELLPGVVPFKPGAPEVPVPGAVATLEGLVQGVAIDPDDVCARASPAAPASAEAVTSAVNFFLVAFIFKTPWWVERHGVLAMPAPVGRCEAGHAAHVTLTRFNPRSVSVRTFICAVALSLAGSAVLAEAPAVKTKSGLVYQSIKEGSGASPTASDIVKVNYRGTLSDGKEFDSSYKRGEPAEFPLNHVIPCWTEGVQMMKPGGKARLTCPPSIAYGPSGAGGVIPPNATLQFEIELLAVKH